MAKPSALETAGGIFVGILANLCKGVTLAGGNVEMLHRLANPDDMLLHEVVRKIVEAGQTKWSVCVDHTLSFIQMIGFAEINDCVVDPNIKDYVFPPGRSLEKRSWVLRPFEINAEADIPTVVKKMNDNGQAPAWIEDLVALAAQIKPINGLVLVAPGTVITTKEYRVVASLSCVRVPGRDSKPRWALDFVDFNAVFPAGTKFAVVSKQ
jgi:hypothetical protein